MRSGWTILAVALISGLLIAMPSGIASAQNTPNVAPLAPLQTIPAATPITIRPRVFSAYGALIAAAMLSVLYLYRGRAFIVYWLGSWILIAAALAIVSRSYADPRLDAVLAGLALLLVVWSAGLVCLAARAYPQNPLRWSTPLKVAAITAVWFLASPFVVPVTAVTGSGVLAASALLGWSAARYLALARDRRHAGAFLIGGGLAVICVANCAAVAINAGALGDAGLLNRLAGVNVVTSMFVALGMHLLVFEDMTVELRSTNTELASANEAVKRLAITDPLTGCHNRRFFEEIERRELQRHRRYGAPLSLVFVDVNHFKQLNDSLGHDRGDDALRTIGAMLRRQVRESDYVIRWGGDEFLLLLTCPVAEAEAKAADLKKAFVREREIAELPSRLGLSIGVATVSLEADSLHEAIQEADSRMYRDKLLDRAPL